MTYAKNYETVSTVVEVMQKKTAASFFLFLLTLKVNTNDNWVATPARLRLSHGQF